MIKKILFSLVVLAAVFGCEKPGILNPDGDVQILKASKKDKTNNGKNKKKTFTKYLDVKAEDGDEPSTKAYDESLVWHWEYGDALLGYQIASDKIRNRLEYNIQTGLFFCPDFTYQSNAHERFHFVYPHGAEYQKGQLRPLQDGIWRPVCVTTTEAVKIDNLPYLSFEQLSSALEIRIWSQTNSSMQERVVSAVLTSDSDFVANWTLDESTMTYTQSLKGKEIYVGNLNTSIVQINMPHLPEGYPAGTEIKLVLTREDGRTMTTTLPSELTFVKQKRTVYNLKFKPDPRFICATYNVDGLPSIINSDGAGSNGTKSISSKLAASDWDFIGFQEDFEYHSNLVSSMGMYVFGKHRGSVGVANIAIKADTDGLGFATLSSTCSWSNETFVEFTNKYGGLFDGANTIIKKGFRYYLVTMKDGVEFDVYVTHMNSGSDTGHINARASQFQQLANYINAHRSGRPIIILGDFNARYTRDDYKTNFWDVLDADLYANLHDPWADIIWGGGYPDYGTPSWVVSDKYNPNNTVGDIEFGEQDGEVVDKILYINDPDSDIRIFAKTYMRDMAYTWADHTPVVVEFGYEIVK